MLKDRIIPILYLIKTLSFTLSYTPYSLFVGLFFSKLILFLKKPKKIQVSAKNYFPQTRMIANKIIARAALLPFHIYNLQLLRRNEG